MEQTETSFPKEWELQEIQIKNLQAKIERLQKTIASLESKTQTISGSYQFLNNPEEDIYTEEDGETLKGGGL